MKQPRTPSQSVPAYSAKEVHEILEKAKALGVITIKLQGFEASFVLDPNLISEISGSSAGPARFESPYLPTPESGRYMVRPPERGHEQSGPECERCGREKVRSKLRYGPSHYCRACWVKDKERKDWERHRRY